jgi:hypothetical protein
MTQAEPTVSRYTIKPLGPDPIRTIIERGPKGKRSVAFAIDWPGWSRGARSTELALETLESYRERYRPVAGLAGMAREFDAAEPLDIVEDRVGTDRRLSYQTGSPMVVNSYTTRMGVTVSAHRHDRAPSGRIVRFVLCGSLIERSDFLR